MVDERDIHGQEGRLETILRRLENSPEINSENVDVIKEFNHHLKTVRTVKLDRRNFYLQRLSKIAKWVDTPFQEMSKEDIKEIQAKIEEKDYTEWTKHDYLLAIRKFFQWLHRDELENYSWKSNDFPAIVRNVDPSVGKDGRKLPRNLPEKEEVKQMTGECRNSRDKAVLMSLFDGGFRAGEFLNMKIGDLKQMERGTSVIVHGKTGSRQVLMPMAEPYLNRWLEEHPDTVDSSYLWVNIGNRNHGEPMRYQSLRKMLKTCKKKAGLSCKVNPHAFRKASATFYAQHLNEVQLCDRYGWVYGSDMPRIYIKKSGKRTNNAVLKAHGIEVEEAERGKEMKPRVCSRCEDSNPYDAEKCGNCGLLLDRSKVTEEHISKDRLEDELVKMVESNPDKWGSVFLKALEKSKK